ncbi:MAG: acyl transferase [Ekhidna sp.]
MDFADSFKKKLFTIKNESFDSLTLEVFVYQYNNNVLYKKFCDSLNKNEENVKSVREIPFLPIDFFKNHIIKTGKWEEKKVFKSSGTTSSARSKHYIKDVNFYLKNTINIFEQFFESISEYQIIALLPSYQEQGDSSLICMVDHFMSVSKFQGHFALNENIAELLSSEKKKILFGVSYALWDLAEKNVVARNTFVIETGGMKGRKRELIRSELHSILQKGLSQDKIWSEYGMTELQSQGYGIDGLFQFPTWTKALIRDINDPFRYVQDGKSGGINIIDLANIDTCSFIETKDLGRKNGNYFEVLGRFDNSDIRGCNLMI